MTSLRTRCEGLPKRRAHAGPQVRPPTPAAWLRAEAQRQIPRIRANLADVAAQRRYVLKHRDLPARKSRLVELQAERDVLIEDLRLARRLARVSLTWTDLGIDDQPTARGR